MLKDSWQTNQILCGPKYIYLPFVNWPLRSFDYRGATVPPVRMVTSTRAYALLVNFITRAYFFQNIHERLLCTRK